MFLIRLGVGLETEGLIHRNPSFALNVDDRPIVQVLVVRMHHEAALEMGRNAGSTTKRDKEQAHLAAVAGAIVDRIFRDIIEGGIFAR